MILPGAESSFGVMRNHAPLIAALQAGVVRFFDADGRENSLVIGGGFFQVSNNQAMILADSAERPQEIDLARARESESRARSRLEGALEGEMQVQKDRAAAALKRAQVRLKNASGS